MIALFSLIINIGITLFFSITVYANEEDGLLLDVPTATSFSTAYPTETPIPTPTIEPLFIITPYSTPSSTPTPTQAPLLWSLQNGVYTTEILKLGVTYRFPPNEAVSLTFSKLPDTSGTVSLIEREVPAGVINAVSKDYEITSLMPIGSFELNLTLPVTNQTKKVFSSQDGENYSPITNETTFSSEIVTIKHINHLTHFIVADQSADFHHPVINEFYVTGGSEWVELYNPSNESINLQGWALDNTYLSDDKFIFDSQIINPHEFLLLEANFGFNDEGDTVRFLDSSENLVDSRQYSQNPGSSSIGAAIDGAGVFTTFTTPTKGITNGTVLQTLFVDQNWDSPDNDGGHIWGFDAFAKIQDAINFAPVGSQIIVEPGEYYETLAIDKSLKLTGPGIDGESQVYIYSECERTVAISASNVTLEGFNLQDDEGDCYPIIQVNPKVTDVTIKGNSIGYGYRGIVLTPNSKNNKILNNSIYGNSIGIKVGGSQNNLISGNQIDNNTSGIELTAGGSGGGLGVNASSDVDGNTISENTISNNDYGVYGRDDITFNDLNIERNSIRNNYNTGIYFEGASGDVILTIDGNDIENNSIEGIYLGEIMGVTIQNNNILNNGGETEYTGIVIIKATGNQAHQNIISGNGVGVNNQDEGNPFDATQNYWGHESGPYQSELNPDGEGDSVNGKVLFSPFYTNQEKTQDQHFQFTPDDINSLAERGIFDLPDDEEGEEMVRLLTVWQQVEFEVLQNGRINNVLIPHGTVIRRSDNNEFDWDSLSLTEINHEILSGLANGQIVKEAIQWGLPDIELEFNQPLTLKIFVGTDLNGQTLNVVRSTTGSKGWTSDGIVSPATCVVSDGICSFQATKASYYAAVETQTPSSTPSPTVTPTSVSSTNNSSGGDSNTSAGQAPVCIDTKPGNAPKLLQAIAGTNYVTLNWLEAKDPLTYYLVAYGTTDDSLQFGNPNIGGKGTTNYKVEKLSGGISYYFRVRAGNGCMPGDFSNILSVYVEGETFSEPAQGFTSDTSGNAIETQKEANEVTNRKDTQVLSQKLKYIPILVIILIITITSLIFKKYKKSLTGSNYDTKTIG